MWLNSSAAAVVLMLIGFFAFPMTESEPLAATDLYEKYSYKPRYKNKGGYFVDGHPTQNGVEKKRLTTTLLKNIGFSKGTIPQWMWVSNEKTQWAYVKGLLQTDGTVYKGESEGNPVQLSYSDINKDFLKELQLLFSNLGINTAIHLGRKEGVGRKFCNYLSPQ